MTARVLAVRADNLGDVVLMGPAVRAIAASGAEVTMLCSPAGAPAAYRLPGVTDVVVARLPWIDAEPEACAPAALDSIARSVREVGADEAIIFTSSHQSPLPTALLIRLAGPARIAGISVDYPGSLLDVALRNDDDVHEVERALGLVGAMGHRLPTGDSGRLRLDYAGRAPVSREPDGYVVVHPGASVPARTWSPARWADVVARLGAEGVRIVVTGGAHERALTALVASAHPRAEDLGGALTFDELLDCLGRADVVVVGNTGPAHLAAAVGTPVVSIFPPTVPARRWRPWGVPHVLLGDQDIECRGCRARTCPRAAQSCVDGITSDAVVDAVARLANARAAGTAA